MQKQRKMYGPEYEFAAEIEAVLENRNFARYSGNLKFQTRAERGKY